MICRPSWQFILSRSLSCLRSSLSSALSRNPAISNIILKASYLRASAAYRGPIAPATANLVVAAMPPELNFDLITKDGKARTGRLTHKNGTVETPAVLLYNRRGSALHLTPDLLETLGEGANSFIMDASHFLGNPTPATLAKAPGQGRGFLALEGAFLVASARDATIFTYPRDGNGSDKGTRIEAWAGSFTLSPDAYQGVVKVLQPDLFVPLVDEVPAGAKSRRVQKAIDRTLRWLDAALARASQSDIPTPALLAPIQGGSLPEQWRRSAQEASKRASNGYAFCGLGTGETLKQRRMCLDAALAELPAEGPRLLVAGLLLDAILDAVALGVDLFDGACIVQASLAGTALDLGAATSGLAEETPIELDMWDLAYSKDTGPLVKGCLCFACLNHTRAYVHHLLEVHEMTAMVLLEMHNTHQVLRFMEEVRAAISKSSFEQLRQAFAIRQRRPDSCALVN